MALDDVVFRLTVGAGGLPMFLRLPAAGDAATRAAAGPVAGGVAAALALAPALPKLVALERWLGQGLGAPELQPDTAAIPPETPPPVLTLQMSGASITLPLASLPVLPFGTAPEPGLLTLWPNLRVRACVQRLDAGALDEEGICEGALLLLPDSFQQPGGLALRLHRPSWPTLRLQGWQPSGPGLAFTSARIDAAWPPHTEAAWRVELEAPLVLPASAWFGGTGELALPPDTPWVLSLGPRRVARGELVPAAQGFGLRIVQMLHTAAA
jgi:hypothetical protein